VVLLLISLIAYGIIGVLSGILAGLLGIGGGVIAVPCLYFIFSFLDFPQPYLMHLAIGTSLASMILNTLSSTLGHNKRGSVVWKVVKQMALGLVLGTVLGALSANLLSGIVLEIFFGVFLLILAWHFWKHEPHYDELYHLPRTRILFIWSTGIGAVSNLLGIGGGTLIVPLLNAYKIPHKKAIGTSSACSLILTTAGTIAYLIVGWENTQFPITLGYINLPAFVVVGITSFFSARYGVKLAHELNAKKVRKIFAVVLLVTGLMMVI